LEAVKVVAFQGSAGSEVANKDLVALEDSEAANKGSEALVVSEVAVTKVALVV